jgi:hypothetical protein
MNFPMSHKGFLKDIMVIGLAMIIFTSLGFVSINNIYAENENSLVGCVYYYMSFYDKALANSTEEQRQNITQDPFKNPESVKMITTQACLLAHQDTGKYANLFFFNPVFLKL